MEKEKPCLFSAQAMKRAYLESTIGCSHPRCRQPGSSESCRLEDASVLRLDPAAGWPWCTSCNQDAAWVASRQALTCLTGRPSEGCWWAGSCELHQRLFPPLSTLGEPRLSGSSCGGAFPCPGTLFAPRPRYWTPHQLCWRSSGLQLSLGHGSS